MARRKKATPDEPTEGNGLGHNGPPSAEMTEQQKQALAIQHKKHYQASLARKKEADADFKNVCKRAKAEVGDDAVDLIKDMILLETEEGEAKIKAGIERQKRAALYMAAPLGAQFSMFEDRTPAVDRAREEGVRDGMEGKTLHPPYDPGTEQFQSYQDGWHQGQAAIFDIQKLEDASAFDEVADDIGDTDPIGDQEPTYETA